MALKIRTKVLNDKEKSACLDVLKQALYQQVDKATIESLRVLTDQESGNSYCELRVGAMLGLPKEEMASDAEEEEEQ